jgi:hypothetical protein
LDSDPNELEKWAAGTSERLYLFLRLEASRYTEARTENFDQPAGLVEVLTKEIARDDLWRRDKRPLDAPLIFL